MLQNIAYCPILYTRVAEMKALFQLPATSKDRMFPVLSARPWPNAKQLSRTWEKIGEAFGSRRFALDLDPTRRLSSSGKPAAEQFAALFNPASGYAAYYEAVEGVPFAIPVIRISEDGITDLEGQARHIERIDRGAVLRLAFTGSVPPLRLLSAVIERIADLTIFVDMGWANDLIARELWASQIIGQVANIAPETELVVAGSSFPDTFASIGARGTLALAERSIYSNLVRRHNSVALVYGDWGSTRPPSTLDVPMRNIPRIDLPLPGQWIFFRQDKSQPSSEDYEDVARRAVGDPDWPRGLNLWGTYAIESTAQGLPGAIKSPGIAAAARINIHLHRQAFFGADVVTGDADEPFTDD
ncbi:beta family protein [Sphingomonas kyungheensis]|uniref:Beta protein n=1 Tax=Sphingomonas kyungheensis TaxID=1069987 RepID=A0ABU8H2N8_9SPHN